MALLNMDKAGADRLEATVRRVMGQPIGGEKGKPPSGRVFGGGDSLLVKLGEEDPDNAGRYKWKLQIFKGSDDKWADDGVQPTAGELFIAREANATPGLSGKYVEIVQRGVDADGKAVFAFAAISGVFPVIVAQDGGADGSVTTECSWTYTVKDEASNTLKKNSAGDDATAIAPTMQRLKCKTNKAGRGLAYYTADGTLELLWVDETPDLKKYSVPIDWDISVTCNDDRSITGSITPKTYQDVYGP